MIIFVQNYIDIYTRGAAASSRPFFASFMVLMKWHERGLIMQKIQSENKYAPPMRSKKKIGNTTFIVNSFFPQTGNQTIASKLENLIKADVQKQTVT